MFIHYDHKAHATDNEEISLKTVISDMKSGMSYLYAQKAILATILMALCINFFLARSFQMLFHIFIEFGLGNEPTYLWDRFLTRETWYSITSVAFSVSSILMALYLSTKKTKDTYSKHFKQAILGAVIVVSLIAINMVLYYLDVIQIDMTLIGLTFSLFLMGFILMSFNVPMSLIIQRNVDPNN
jgi:hypothetical protein